MMESPLVCKCLKILRSKLRAVVWPQHVWNSGLTKQFGESCNHVADCNVSSHGDYSRPISVAVHYHQIIFPSMVAKICCNLLKWLQWFGLKITGSFGCDGRVSWQCWQARIIWSMSWSIPGQYTVKCALCFVRVDPWWSSWSCLFTHCTWYDQSTSIYNQIFLYRQMVVNLPQWPGLIWQHVSVVHNTLFQLLITMVFSSACLRKSCTRILSLSLWWILLISAIERSWSLPSASNSSGAGMLTGFLDNASGAWFVAPLYHMALKLNADLHSHAL